MLLPIDVTVSVPLCRKGAKNDRQIYEWRFTYGPRPMIVTVDQVALA